MVVLFHDEDANTELDERTDHFTSIGQVTLIYLEGALGDTLLNAAFQPGWNVRSFHPESGIDYGQAMEPTGIQLHQNILPTLSLRVEGAYELDVDSAQVNIVVTSPEDLADETELLTTMDRPIAEKGGVWGQTLNTAPPSG